MTLRQPHDVRPSHRTRRLGRSALLCGILLAASVPFGQGVAHAAADDVDVERLSGPTRYETAVAIAERFAAESPVSPDAAIVVSGYDEHAPCALAAASLAGMHGAPVLLTEPDSLPAAAEEFLSRSSVRRVFIVGGTAQVSGALAEQLRQVTGAAPQRLGGTDCVQAALAVARRIGNVGAVAGRGRTALLATGGVPADGLAAGPLAYRGRLPLLFARNDVLDASHREYLTRSVDHVIILGGTAAVSESVERQVRALGVTTVRWAGVDRYASAARIASELLDGNAPISCVDGSGVGLAAGIGPADAIASAPLLGQRCEPLLLTETLRLPRPTAQALSADELAGDDAGRLRLTLFGGNAAISRNVQTTAAAAASAHEAVGIIPFSVSVVAAEGACHWIVDFSRPVLAADARQPANYAFDREPLTYELADIHVGDGDTTTRAVMVLAGASAYDTASVPIGCVTPLAVRDRLGVTAGKIRAADASGRNEGAELVVKADTARPVLRVYAAPGDDTAWVRSGEPLAEGTVEVTLTRGRSRIHKTASVLRGDTSFRVTFDFPSYNSYDSTTLPFTQPPWFSAGDKITLPAGKLRDLAGNSSASVTRTVAADTTAPNVRSVTLTNPAPRSDGLAAVDVEVSWSEPVKGCGFGPGGRKIDLGELQIDVDADGFAEFSLDGAGATSAGVSFVDAPDANTWVTAGTAACDQSWRESDGLLVARIAASSRDALPRTGSKIIVAAAAAYDFAGNPNAPHSVAVSAAP